MTDEDLIDMDFDAIDSALDRGFVEYVPVPAHRPAGGYRDFGLVPAGYFGWSENGWNGWRLTAKGRAA